MPELYFYGNQFLSATEMDEFRKVFRETPIHRGEIVLIIWDSQPQNIEGDGMPFIRIEGSVDISDYDLIAIADHFNRIIDVSVRFSWGPMVFREKGKGFGKEAINEAWRKMRDIVESFGVSGSRL